MKTKEGETIPGDLVSELQADNVILEMWNKLPPSCQRRYVRLVIEAKRPETRIRRIGRVLRMTEEYYRRHFGKY